MKKLALIVLLAVVASQVLADRDDSGDHRAPRPSGILSMIFDDATPATPTPPLVAAPRTPEPAPDIRTIPWRGGDSNVTGTQPPPARGPRTKRRSLAKPIEPSTPQAAPSWFPKSDWEEEGLARSNPQGIRVLLGRLSASEERAKADLRKTVNHELADWLAADIPMTWTPPAKLVNRMVLGTYVQTATWSFGPRQGDVTPGLPPAAKVAVPELDEPQIMYRAGQRLDFSAVRRAEFVESYHRDVASTRMRRSGGLIAVVLTLLALTSLYVRADEATKGYYTNRLRVLATVGLGVASAAAYRYWA